MISTSVLFMLQFYFMEVQYLLNHVFIILGPEPEGSICCFLVLEIEPSASHMYGERSTAELYLHPMRKA